MTSRLPRLARHPLLLALLALLMVYTLAGFTLVPWLVHRYAPRVVAERTGHTLAIDDVQANPYRLRLETRGVRLQAPDGATVARVDRLMADLEVSSLWRRAWTFGALEVDRPEVNVVIDEHGVLNLAKLLRHDAPAENASDGPPRSIVRRGAIRQGSVSFEDRSHGAAASVVITPIDVEVTELATLPDREGRYAVAAALPGGGRVAWRGDVSLRPLASAGEVVLEGLQAGTLWPFVRERLALDKVQGALSASAHYRFAQGGGATTLTIDDARGALSALTLTFRDRSEPPLEVSAVEAEGVRMDLQTRELSVARIAVRDGRLAAAVDAQGDLDWAHLARPSGAPAKSPVAARPWRVKVDELALEALSVHYADRSRKLPLAFAGRLARASARVSATLGGAASTAILVDGAGGELRSLTIQAADADRPLVALDALRVEQVRVDGDARDLRVGRIALDGGRALLERNADGSMGLVEAFSESDAGAARRELRAAARAAEAEGRPWTYALGELHVAGIALTLRDAGLGLEPALEYVAELSRAAVTGIERNGRDPWHFQARIAAQAGGSLEAAGQGAQDFSSASGSVTVKGLALPPGQPILGRYAKLVLASGLLDAALQVRYVGGDRPAFDATGDVQVAGLRVNEEDSGDRFLAWRTLAARSVRYSSMPARLLVRELQLVEPGAKLVVAENRQVNVAQVWREQPKNAPDRSTDAKPASTPPLAIDVQRLTLTGGTVDFADLSLVLPFSTRVQAVNGTVLGISTDRSRRAEVKAAGRIADYGAARLSGSLLPSAPTQYTNLRAEFENVAMPPLSPYSATFAGRTIAAGRLWLDVAYRIEDRRLLGENKLVLADLRLGERVEAPRALDLPLDLAVALLTDAQGRINLAVPVRGDLGNPKFSYGEVMREALGNVITRVVSAPFRALGALAGGKGDAAPAMIAFEPGEAELPPPEREKLDRIAQVLRERPQLQLVVPQPFDAKLDVAALKADAAARALAKHLGREVKAGEDPGPLAYDDAETQRALERMLTERGGADAMAKFVAEYGQKAGRKPDRVNAALALFGRGRGDPDFYRALQERLVETQPLPEGAAESLAGARAKRIEAYLVQEAGVDGARVRTGALRDAAVRNGDVAAELKLDVLKRG